MQSLSQQQDRINDTVDGLVEKKMAGMTSEMAVLRRRVEDLEDTLRNGNRVQNGLPCGAPLAPESYSFPPVPVHDTAASSSRLRAERPGLSRRLSSPGWGQERDKEGRSLPQPHQHQHQHQHQESDNMNNGSPAPFDARRLSMSATRLDPPRVQHNGSAMQSPPQGYREHNHNNHNSSNSSAKQQQQQHVVYPPTPTTSHQSHSSSRNGGDRPLSRQNSSLPIVIREHDSGSGRRAGSRRNSIVMSGPDGES